MAAMSLHLILSSFPTDLETKLHSRHLHRGTEQCMFISVPLFASSSFLVDEDLWLVMEYMDGGTLQDIVRHTRMAEGEMAAVSREVRDPACASHALDTMLLPSRA